MTPYLLWPRYINDMSAITIQESPPPPPLRLTSFMDDPLPGFGLEEIELGNCWESNIALSCSRDQIYDH